MNELISDRGQQPGQGCPVVLERQLGLKAGPSFPWWAGAAPCQAPSNTAKG